MAETVPKDELLLRAEEACAVAARTVSPEAKLMLLGLARCYESLAKCVARNAQLEQALGHRCGCEPKPRIRLRSSSR